MESPSGRSLVLPSWSFAGQPPRVTTPKSPSLPPDLTTAQIRKAVDYIEKQASDLVEVYEEQRNVFSALVGIFGVKALHSYSAYKKARDPAVAQQKFPDLSHGGKPNPPPERALESKGSSRPWALQSHYDHPGWYIVWRYLMDPTETIKPGLAVVVWRVDVVFIKKDQWKYEGSKAGATGGGRTHTFGLKSPAKMLREAAAYKLAGIVIKGGQPTLGVEDEGDEAEDEE